MHVIHAGNLEQFDDQPCLVITGTKEEIKAAAKNFVLEDVELVHPSRLLSIREAIEQRDYDAAHRLTFFTS